MSRFLPRIDSLFQGANTDEESRSPSATPLHSSTGCAKESDGSITVSMKLDKDKVECCVCLSPMSGHIYKCKGSSPRESAAGKQRVITHNICKSCEWQMRRIKEHHGRIKKMQCPICKVQGAFTRNRSLEKQLSKLSTPCRHSKHGCSHRFFPWDEHRELHETYLCLFLPADCPFCHQTIPGGRANFVEHLVRSMATQSGPQNNHNHNGHGDGGRDHVRSIELDLDSDLDEHDEEMSSGPFPRLQLDHFIDQRSRSRSPQNTENNDNVHRQEEERKANESSSTTENERARGEDIGNVDPHKIHKVPGCTVLFAEAQPDEDEERYVLHRDRNEFVADFDLGIAFCFISPSEECPGWRVYAVSISPRHGLCGNSKVYIQHSDHGERGRYMENEVMVGSATQRLVPPVETTLMLQLGRCHNTALRQHFKSYNPQSSETEITQKPAIRSRGTTTLNESDFKENEEDKMEMEMDTDSDPQSQDSLALELEEYAPSLFKGQSPCSPTQCGFIYAGNPSHGQPGIKQLSVRIFTLEHSFQSGAVIDARDHNGDWYLAEVKQVRDEDGNEFINSGLEEPAHDDYLGVRQAKIHWLGYPTLYDEWIDVDSDSHRIAQRGTFTVGPDLRALRKHDLALRALANRNAGNPPNRAVPRLTR